MLGTVNKLGILGTVVTTAVNLGCCVGAVFGPLAGVLITGGLFDRIPAEWQFPLLYGFLAVALVGFGLGWRTHRRLYPMLLFLPGGAAILYPFHESLDVWVLQLLIWLGFGLLLAAAGWDAWLAFRTHNCRLPVSRLEVSQ